MAAYEKSTWDTMRKMAGPNEEFGSAFVVYLWCDMRRLPQDKIDVFEGRNWLQQVQVEAPEHGAQVEIRNDLVYFVWPVHPDPEGEDLSGVGPMAKEDADRMFLMGQDEQGSLGLPEQNSADIPTENAAAPFTISLDNLNLLELGKMNWVAGDLGQQAGRMLRDIEVHELPLIKTALGAGELAMKYLEKRQDGFRTFTLIEDRTGEPVIVCAKDVLTEDQMKAAFLLWLGMQASTDFMGAEPVDVNDLTIREMVVFPKIVRSL